MVQSMFGVGILKKLLQYNNGRAQFSTGMIKTGHFIKTMFVQKIKQNVCYIYAMV